jgi:hypothetical protein
MEGRSRRSRRPASFFADLYASRTGRSALDEARLGWALATRAAVKEHAMRAFANAERRWRGARALKEPEVWPGWVDDGVARLRPVFARYAEVDPGWRLLVERPKIVEEIGLLDEDGGAWALARLAGSAEMAAALERARAELELGPAGRARDEAMRAFFAGVVARRGEVPAVWELGLLSLAVGLEETSDTEPVRRRWKERRARWAEAAEPVSAALVALDRKLDGIALVPREDEHVQSPSEFAKEGEGFRGRE